MASPNRSIAAAEAIMRSIDTGETKPIYLLHGSEPYLCDSLCEYFISHAIPQEARDFNITVFYGLDTSDSAVAQQCKQLPMGAAKRLVVVREAQMLKSLKILVNYANQHVKSSILVLNFHGAVKQNTPPVKELFAAVKKHGVVYESEAFREYQIDGWIKDRAKSKGLELQPQALAILKENIGTELDKLENALETLHLSMDKGESKVTKEKVCDTIGVNRDFNVFNLTNAIGKGDRARALQIAQYMASKSKGNEVPPILDRVAHYFYQILQFQTLDGRMPHDEVAKSMGVHPYFLQEFQRAATRYPLRSIPQIFTWLRYIDMMSKGYYGDTPAQEELLKEMIIRIVK